MNIPSTLRARLLAWYIGTTAIMLFTLTSLFGIIFWFVIREQIDHHTHIVALEAKQVVEQYSGNERERLLKNLVSARGMTVVLLSPDGSPVLQTNSSDLAVMSEHQLQKLLVSTPNISGAPQHFTLSNLRFATLLVSETGGNRDILAVGYSTEILDQTFRQVLFVLTGTVVLVVFPLGWLGSRLLRRFLHPLESIAETAKSIRRSPELKQRFHADHATAELSAITSAFNQMLSRLHQVFLDEHRFFSDTAHGLKTPIAVLRARVEKLSRISLNEKNGLLEKIDNLSNTIQDLLFVSSLATQPPNQAQPVALSSLLLELSELAQLVGETRRLSLISHIPRNISINSDPVLVKRLLTSILHNALSYTEPGGTVTLKLRQDAVRKTATITIADTGVGIAPEDQKLVFSRFFRGRNAKNVPGTGLGLAIAKAIAENLGGSIRLRSILGKGTTVTITLPFSSSLHVR